MHGISDQAGTVLQEEPPKDGQWRRDDVESGPRTVLYKDSLKGKHLRRDDRHSLNSATA
jgi:hypothetical protein